MAGILVDLCRREGGNRVKTRYLQWIRLIAVARHCRRIICVKLGKNKLLISKQQESDQKLIGNQLAINKLKPEKIEGFRP
jgi:hypothetical protein